MSVFVIAEAGVNHGGNLATAFKLAQAAKESGADAVKYQLFNSQRLWGDDRIKHLELSWPQMRDVAAYCKAIGIEFMCTPFGIAELEFLAPLLQRVKIASGCIGRIGLLKAVRNTGLPVILSTGMSKHDDIILALEPVGPLLRQNLTLLHCTSAYPCHLEDVNLRAMLTIKDCFYCDGVGYSDHTSGITVAIAAVALGATVIEKHLTLDRNAEGPDHKSSITPKEFKAMRMAIVEVEAALGDGVKRVMDSEQTLRALWRA